MAAAFIDVDGTVMEWGTETPLIGAIEELRRFAAAGNQIIFVTQRQRDDPDFDMKGLRDLLSLYFPDAQILYGITSPRIVINDQGALAINHLKDSAWHYDLQAIIAFNGAK